MIYNPKYFTSEKLLQITGFTYTANIGWEKPFPEKNTRLHAQTHHGYIELHFDMVKGEEYKAKPSSKNVKKTILLFKKLDTWLVYKIVNSKLNKNIKRKLLKFITK